ncbi:hypothetical protein GWK08_09085 [Leptobacterium flavescens]|uniref:Uncharacterized protein n=1 Tax=Leptobacterium flavescens TaxID=472055 RepID=A0A6P0UP22_9FLAO|nr:hypothetical protein [Leptobacterium flavescens]NER13589.1 hypothetical protein [Leptobacterium flavescens]
MSVYPEYRSVQKCLLQIEEKLNWGPSSQWHNDVFIELSERIQEETHVLLSPTTLKRVWGRVNYKSAPSISTLNTLAGFAGYRNWRDFKNQAETKGPSWIERKISPNLGIITISAAIMTLVFISFYSMTGIGRNPVEEIDLSKIEFSSRPIAKGMPNSVVFDFNIAELRSDSILIQQFWDPTKTISIKNTQTQATGIYYYPGYFRAKLMADGNILKEHDLYIKSDGWMATIDYKPIPKYLSGDELSKNGLSIPEEAINEVAASEEPLVSSIHYVEDMGEIQGDDILIKTAFRNLYREKWAVCQNTRFYILGSKGAMVIPFSIPGCVSDIGLLLNDVYLNGKENDLSAFGTDLSDYRDIMIRIKDKKISISIDGEEIYSTSYNESLGKFAGIRYRFLGAGEVSYLNITDGSTGEVIINEDFK